MKSRSFFGGFIKLGLISPIFFEKTIWILMFFLRYFQWKSDFLTFFRGGRSSSFWGQKLRTNACKKVIILGGGRFGSVLVRKLTSRRFFGVEKWSQGCRKGVRGVSLEGQKSCPSRLKSWSMASKVDSSG